MHLLYIILYICVLFYNKKDFFLNQSSYNPFKSGYLSLVEELVILFFFLRKVKSV